MTTLTAQQLTRQPLHRLYQSQNNDRSSTTAMLCITLMATLVVLLPESATSNASKTPVSAMISDAAPVIPVTLDDSIQQLGLDHFIATATREDTTTLRIKSQLLFSEGSSELGRAGSRALARLFSNSTLHPKSIEIVLVPRSNTSSEFYHEASPLSTYQARLTAVKQTVERFSDATVSLALAKPNSILPR